MGSLGILVPNSSQDGTLRAFKGGTFPSRGSSPAASAVLSNRQEEPESLLPFLVKDTCGVHKAASTGPSNWYYFLLPFRPLYIFTFDFLRLRSTYQRPWLKLVEGRNYVLHSFYYQHLSHCMFLVGEVLFNETNGKQMRVLQRFSTHCTYKLLIKFCSTPKNVFLPVWPKNKKI